MIKTFMAVAAGIMLLAAGCSPAEQLAVQMAEPARHVSSVAPEVTVEQVLNEYNSSRKTVELSTDTDAQYAPLAVAGCACQMGDSYIIYPKVSGPAGEVINSAMCTAVMERAQQLGIPVFADYRVEYNRNGIFSIRMFIYDMYGDEECCIDCVPLTFNSETGEQYRISDFFDSENQNWRGRIPDLITAQAEDFQMVLLSDIMPISDDRPFYITDEAVVIMYDLYEIATYSAGEPEFEIPVDDIAECLDDTSVLNVMLPPEDETGSETTLTTGEPQLPDEETSEELPQENVEADEQIPQQPEDAEEMPNIQDDSEAEQPTEPSEQTDADPAVISDEEELTVMEETQ